VLSVFPAHAPADALAVQELAAFLEAGCPTVSVFQDTAIPAGKDLLAACEEGLAADILLLLLSPASNPARWRREHWEDILVTRAAESRTRMAVVLLEECVFPLLLRRGSAFFDATTARLPALRKLKRWIMGLQLGTQPAMSFSPELESLYRELADQPGKCSTPASIAQRFAQEAAHDFQAVFWIPAQWRSLAQIAGELGSQLDMKLDGSPESNCLHISRVLSEIRCLLVLDAPQVPVDALLPAGRSSVLFTTDPLHISDPPETLAAARGLVSASRLAEAYELLYRLLNSGVEPESCARELVWICEQWDRLEEANALRFHIGPSPAIQLRLF
jgi:TIR domain